LVEGADTEQSGPFMPRQKFQWQTSQAAARSDLVVRSGLPRWIIRVLRQGGVKRMSLLSRLSDDQLLEIPGIGLRSVAVIRAELARVGGRADDAENAVEAHPDDHAADAARRSPEPSTATAQ
jgi:hypothetical protein